MTQRSTGTTNSVELLDAGVRRRLERFGRWTVDRPAPGAEDFRHLDAAAWNAADLRFEPGAGWSGPAWPADPWTVEIDGLTLELRPTSSGGLGLYPEHAANLPWLREQVARRSAADSTPSVLNLFAHTGLATLALAQAGAAVTHVDGARAAVAWARHNAEQSGLADRPVRWIVDDAAAFAAREARRGRRYDGIVLDPPAFGRGRGREWRLESDLAALLGACALIAAPGAFILLTTHAANLSGEELSKLAASSFGRGHRAAEPRSLELVAASGARLPLGWSARFASRP